MKKVALLLALASVVTAAMAGERIVLKDTRTYLEQDGEKVLCSGKPVAVSGELLTRTGEWCDRKVYERKDTVPMTPPPGKQSVVLPKINATLANYRCDSVDKPI